MLALHESSPSQAELTIPTLFLGACPHPNLTQHPNLIGWQPLRHLATLWDRTGAARCDEIPNARWPRILVLPGKSRSEILSSIGTAWNHLEPHGTLLVSLPNDAGAARYEKEVASVCGPVTSWQKHKCRAFLVTHTHNADTDSLSRWHALTKLHPIADGAFSTCAGVFSEDDIDPGSALLAELLPHNLRGRVADLGAGWGFLSATALKTSPAIEHIDLYETDARALNCARANLAPFLATRSAQFFWEDVTQGIHGTHYDTVLMNPPFHSGRHTDVALGVAFIKTAAHALRRGGSLWMVANRQLPYETILDACNVSWWKRAETPVYKVFQATKR